MNSDFIPIRHELNLSFCRIVSVLTAVFAGFIVFTGGAGCEPPQAATPQSDMLSSTTRTLKVYPRLDGHEDRNSVNALTSCKIELARLGYSTVSDQTKADVIARFEVSSSEEASLFQVTVNGQRRVSYLVSVQMTVEDKAGETIYLGRSSYSSNDDDGPATMAKSLVDRMHRSGKISAYAEKYQREIRTAESMKKKKKAQEEAREEAERQRVKEEAEEKENALWKASNAGGCSQPLTPSACEGVQKYIESYPAGRYTAQARQALQEGEVKIQLLLIENDWNSIDRERCKTPKATDDCAALKEHLVRFPSSPHASEVREILTKVDKKLQELARAEKKKADAEAAAEEARQKRIAAEEEAKAKAEALKECKEQCESGCLDWRTGGLRLPCFNRCVARDCR